MQDKVYKIFTEDEWASFQATGEFSGSADDIRDGFIHLSTSDQTEVVIKKFFAGKNPLFIAEFSDPELLRNLTWEVSASGQTYPHLYNRYLMSGDVAGYSKRFHGQE